MDGCVAAMRSGAPRAADYSSASAVISLSWCIMGGYDPSLPAVRVRRYARNGGREGRAMSAFLDSLYVG